MVESAFAALNGNDGFLFSVLQRRGGGPTRLSVGASTFAI
jgi:hypothetical protein